MLIIKERRKIDIVKRYIKKPWSIEVTHKPEFVTEDGTASIVIEGSLLHIKKIEEDVKLCHNCGVENNDYKFCPNCGTNLQQA